MSAPVTLARANFSAFCNAATSQPWRLSTLSGSPHVKAQRTREVCTALLSGVRAFSLKVQALSCVRLIRADTRQASASSLPLTNMTGTHCLYNVLHLGRRLPHEFHVSAKSRIVHKGRASILYFTGKAVGQRRKADARLRDREFRAVGRY